MFLNLSFSLLKGECPSLISIAVGNISTERHSEKKVLILVDGSRFQSIVMGKSWRREPEAVVIFQPRQEQREAERMDACLVPTSFLCSKQVRAQVREWSCPPSAGSSHIREAFTAGLHRYADWPT